MKGFLFAAALLLAAGVFAGDEAPGLLPGLDESRGQAGEAAPLQKPEPGKIMAELSATLRLSSRQEERLNKALTKKTKEFEDQLAQHVKNSAEEKKWRAKAEANRQAMEKINSGLPALVKEYLDDEQRDAYDNLLESRRQREEQAAAAAREVKSPVAAREAPQPAGKKRVLRRKGEAAPAVPARAKAAGSAPKARPKAALAPAQPEEEEGGVMVERQPAAKPKPRLKRKVRRPAPQPAQQEPAEEPEAEPEPAPEPEDDSSVYP
jgi:hypothetical protein